MTAETGSTSRRSALKYLGMGGGTVAASALLAACTGVQEAQNGGKSGPFPSTPQWRFVFLNHLTTNPLFVPTPNRVPSAAPVLCVAQPPRTGLGETNHAPMTSGPGNAA